LTRAGAIAGRYECALVLIDLEQKIYDSEIIVNGQPGSLEHFEGSTNGLEVEALKTIIPYCTGDLWIVGYCDDKASSLTQIPFAAIVIAYTISSAFKLETTNDLLGHALKNQSLNRVKLLIGLIIRSE
jgi:hypothetical protein